MGIGNGNGAGELWADNVIVSVGYPKQFKTAIRRIIKYFQTQGILRLDQFNNNHLLDGQYLDIQPNKGKLELRLASVVDGTLNLRSQKIAEAVLKSPKDQKYPDLNDAQIEFKLYKSVHLEAMDNILLETLRNIPAAPSAHFITQRQFAEFRDRVKNHFAQNGQEISVRESIQNGITSFTFRVDTNKGKVMIARAVTRGQNIQLNILQTLPEAEEAESILRSVTGPNLELGPPESLRSVSETRLGATHVVTGPQRTHDRIGGEATPVNANAYWQGRLYAYAPESDIFNRNRDLTEFKNQIHAGEWKPAPEDLKNLHCRAVMEANLDRYRELRHKKLHPGLHRPDAELTPTRSWARYQMEQWFTKKILASAPPTISDEILNKAVEMFHGKGERDNGRG